MIIKITCNTTEHDSYPPAECEFTQFEINDKSVSIKTMDDTEVVLSETEISIEDAIKIATLILTISKQTKT